MNTIANRMRLSMIDAFKKSGIALGKVGVFNFDDLSFGNVPRDVALNMIKKNSIPFFKTKVLKGSKFEAIFVDIPDSAIDLVFGVGVMDDDE